MECHEFVIFTYKNFDIPINENRVHEYMKEKGVDMESKDPDYLDMVYNRKHEQCKDELESDIGEFGDLDHMRHQVCKEFYKGVMSIENMFDIEFGHRINEHFVGHVGEFLGVREPAEFAWGIFEEFECEHYHEYIEEIMDEEDDDHDSEHDSDHDSDHE